MTATILQAIAAGGALLAIFFWWRRISRLSRPIYRLVTAGVLVRAIAGQLAFWISYLSLPIGRSLQMGDGFWVFALDGKVYAIYASLAARAGLMPIVLLPRGTSSVSFVQVLAVAMLLFGSVASVAMIVNLAAYLGCCRMALSMGRPPDDRAVIVAVAALSLMPSAILWALQPLKDLCFLFFVAAFFAAAYAYQNLWKGRELSAGPRTARATLWSAAMFVSLYSLTGIRWYFGLVIIPVLMLFLLLVVWQSNARLPAAAHSAVLAVLLAIAFYSSAGPLVPVPVRRFVERNGSANAIPKALLSNVNDARASFDRTGAATLLRAGNTTASIEGGTSSGRLLVPSSPVARLFVGTAAILMPRLVAQWLGILDVRGGHGLWTIAEIDTICFDVVLVVIVVSIVSAFRRGGRPTPLFWMILLVTGIIGTVLVYTVSNFGTLFRHRDMILLGIVFLPLAIAPNEKAT